VEQEEQLNFDTWQPGQAHGAVGNTQQCSQEAGAQHCPRQSISGSWSSEEGEV